MKNVARSTGKLEFVKRLPSSKNGNPRFLVKVDGWTCSTQPDTQLGYSIQNWWNKTVTADIGTHYTTRQIDNMWCDDAKPRDYWSKFPNTPTEV
mgnify:FL=1